MVVMEVLRCSQIINILTVTPIAFPDALNVGYGEKKQSNKNDFWFWPKPLEGWYYHQLRWEKLRIE